MNIKQIRERAEIVKENGLTELSVTEGETVIRLTKTSNQVTVAAPVPVAGAPAVVAAETTPAAPVVEAGVDFNKTTEIKSSLIGVFYAAPSPDAAPFVKVGSKVQKGDVLCIIEAMKLMNEIIAEQSGEIVDVCVGNGDVVEFGQTLFKLC